MRKIDCKKGQVTLWIILAIVIVALILLFFNTRIRTGIKGIFTPSTPVGQLQSCVEDKLEEAVGLVSARGGSIEPANSVMYQGEEVEYLCYTNQYYKTCANQRPLLRQHVEREILDYIKPEVVSCIDTLKENLRGKGYDVSGKQEISISIIPNNVKVIVSGVNVRKADAGEFYEEFEVVKNSKLYSLIMISTSILNFEASLGDSDIMTYMIYYPNLKVEKMKLGDGTKIYKLSYSEEDKFVFASRSLSWPAGYGINQIHTPQ